MNEVCRLREEPGPCRAAFPRFFFDTNTGQCRLFIYGGCQGNKNNFRSLQACRMKCSSKTFIFFSLDIYIATSYGIKVYLITNLYEKTAQGN